MGKPFNAELSMLRDTYSWALGQPIERLADFARTSQSVDLLAIGSGGSFSAATFAALVHGVTSGRVAKAVTPLDVITGRGATLLRHSSVLLLSAGGRNPDILAAASRSLRDEAFRMGVICGQPNSPLAEALSGKAFVDFVGFQSPAGKDGFLATNSLIAMMVLIARSYGFSLAPNLQPDPNDDEKWRSATSKETLIVLYGDWGLPVAVDLESKLTEAALAPAQIADYRNFAHGRHHWLAKREPTSGVIALVTPTSRSLAERTLDLLPDSVPIVRLEASVDGPEATLRLLVQAMQFVGILGESRAIDPGRPGVPTFGRQIYHLKIDDRRMRVDGRKEAAVKRKLATLEYSPSAAAQITELVRQALESFLARLQSARFGGLVLDYDGTMCSPARRFVGMDPSIVDQCNRLLAAGMMLGIATGRGKSVKKDLRSVIDSRYWAQTIVGYYNGTQTGFLTAEDIPNVDIPFHASIKAAADLLAHQQEFRIIAEWDPRPTQLTFSAKSVSPSVLGAMLRTLFIREGIDELEIVESSHSLDVIPAGPGKLCVVRQIEDQVGQAEILCIGDRGRWPGNDYLLLSRPYSLSVDETSSDLRTCWNVAPIGCRGVEATTEYLQALESEGTRMRFVFGDS